jgi:hypothetical protein
MTTMILAKIFLIAAIVWFFSPTVKEIDDKELYWFF